MIGWAGILILLCMGDFTPPVLALHAKWIVLTFWTKGLSLKLQNPLAGGWLLTPLSCPKNELDLKALFVQKVVMG